MIRSLAPLATLLALAACVVPIPVPEGTPGAFEIPLDPGDSCGARGLQDFVGQDESVVLATTFTVPIRLIRPGDVVTMDFSPERVNFRTDGAGRIASVDCG